MIRPAPPAAARSAAKDRTPYLSTGFQYVMTRAGTPVPATASTVRSTSATRTPPVSARCTASWMTGPSISGSEYGRPTSTMSAPERAIASAASIPASTEGKASGR